jgi:hypothetical protein
VIFIRSVADCGRLTLLSAEIFKKEQAKKNPATGLQDFEMI